MRAWKSSAFSNTTARPLCVIKAGVAALGLMTAPRGARLPRSTAMPALSLNGVRSGRITSGLSFLASAMFSPSVLPFAVSAPACRYGSISFISAGRPPA